MLMLLVFFESADKFTVLVVAKFGMLMNYIVRIAADKLSVFVIAGFTVLMYGRKLV